MNEPTELPEGTELVPVRRVRLPKTRTHLCYSIDTDKEIVMVLAVWGALKGRGPFLLRSSSGGER